MLTYNDLELTGYLVDYGLSNDGTFIEVWDVSADIYHCVWYGLNTLDDPDKIVKVTNENQC